MKALIHASIAACLFLAATLPSTAMIDVGDLSKEEAKKLGISMKSRANGDAGILVWVEFKKVDFLEHFTYAEFQLNDAQGKHLASAKLQPLPVVHGQAPDVISVSFSVDPSQLENCSIMLVAYGSSQGDVGSILRTKDFLDLKKAKD